MSKSRSRRLKESIKHTQQMMYTVRFEFNYSSRSIMIREYVKFCKLARTELRRME